MGSKRQNLPMGASLWMWRDNVIGFAPNFAASEYFYWTKMSVWK